MTSTIKFAVTERQAAILSNKGPHAVEIWLNDWFQRKFHAEPAFVLAVIRAYDRLIAD